MAPQPHSRRAKRRGSRRGQVVVETAIVMPFFVFLMLGLLQLSLLHQARVLAKYAAFKAVRVGAIHNAKHTAMTSAALAVLLPMTGRRNTESFYNATSGSFGSSWSSAKSLNDDKSKPLLEVTICEPYGSISGDFDDPTGPMGTVGKGGATGASPDGTDEGGDPVGATDKDATWHQFNAGRLAIQVTMYHQMVVPFANSVLWHIVAGQERAETMRVLRMNPETANESKFNLAGTFVEKPWIKQLADGTPPLYIMPIRASWSMRMQSNFLPDKGGFEIPGANNCKVPWK